MKKWQKIFFGILIIPLAFLFTACGDEILMHNIEVTASDSRLGDISGTGRYQTGSIIELRATPKGTNTFLGWVYKERLVSKDNPMSLNVNAETEGKYIAVFDEPNVAWQSFKSANITTGTGITNVHITLKLGQNIDFLTTIWEGNIAITDGVGQIEMENNFVMNLNEIYDYNIMVTITEYEQQRQFPKVGKISKQTGTGITTEINPLVISQPVNGSLFKINFDVSKI